MQIKLSDLLGSGAGLKFAFGFHVLSGSWLASQWLSVHAIYYTPNSLRGPARI